MKKTKISLILFVVCMLLFHYHSTGHFIWALLGIPYKYPLDPIEGDWAMLKGFLPPIAMVLAYVAGIISKYKDEDTSV